MKKYLLVNKKTNEVFGKFYTPNEASEALCDFLCQRNEYISTDNVAYISLFDFEVKEEEMREITSYEEACDYLGLPKSDIAMCVSDKHNKALIALAKLFTIAEAWNKEDGFVPDFSNKSQDKYFPWFEHNNETAGFVCASANLTVAYAAVSSRLCFETRKRAFDFGKQFEDLYNDFLIFEKQ